jgi:hypothetical protein
MYLEFQTMEKLHKPNDYGDIKLLKNISLQPQIERYSFHHWDR